MTYREKYDLWCQSPAVDEATKAELRSIEKNEDEIKLRFDADLSFGTAGLRGMLLPLLLVWTFFRVWGIPGSAAAVPVSELLTFTVGAVIIFRLNRRHLSRGRRAAVLVHLPRIR